LNEFGCSGEQPSSFILHDQNLNEFGSAGALLEGVLLHDRKILGGCAGAQPSRDHNFSACRFADFTICR